MISSASIIKDGLTENQMKNACVRLRNPKEDSDEEKQWDCLISELNTYGFNFDKSIKGIDKLRTLYYGKEMFSKNQNS